LNIQNVHAASIVFFILAFVFYFVASNFAIVFGVLGILSEVIAWVIWLSKGNSGSTNDGTGSE
jgi:hypothetical protein